LRRISADDGIVNLLKRDAVGQVGRVASTVTMLVNGD